MKTTMSWKEWAGVTAVGVGLGYAARTAANAQTGQAHQTAMLVSGAMLYIIGVGIGSNRPDEGWIGTGDDEGEEDLGYLGGFASNLGDLALTNLGGVELNGIALDNGAPVAPPVRRMGPRSVS